MSRLILHIGTHKTATTTIQRTLHENRLELEKHAIFYPDLPPGKGHHVLGPTLALRNPDKFQLSPEGICALWKEVATRYAPEKGTLLLSSESFSRAAPRRLDLAQIRETLSSFEEIEVICVLRDQVSYLQALYLQVAKNRVPPPVEEFIAQALETGIGGMGIWVDYGALYDHLLTAFRPEEIRFVTFDSLKRHPDGVLGGFLQFIPGAPPASSLKPVGDGFSNVSPDPLALWAACRVAGPEKSSPELVARAKRAIQAVFGEGQRTTVYTPAEIRQICECFTPKNLAFEQRVQQVQPGFRMPALPDRLDAVGRDQVNDALWIAFLKVLWQELTPAPSDEPATA